MRNEFGIFFPTTKHYEVALEGIRQAAKQMLSKPRRRERLTRIAIGVSSASVIWGELGICDAGDTTRSYAVIDLAVLTEGALSQVTAKQLHYLMFGRPNAAEITVQLLCAMLSHREHEESGAKTSSPKDADVPLFKIAHHIAVGVPDLIGH